MELQGEDGLFANFDKSKKRMDEASLQGLQRLGLQIIEDAKRNIRTNGSINTGLMRASGRVEVLDNRQEVEVGFFAQQGEGYAAAVENGRGPTRQAGQIPLKNQIRAWVHKKLRLSGKALDAATFLITRKIHRKGIKPMPFFRPALEKNQQAAERIIGDKMKKEAQL